MKFNSLTNNQQLIIASHLKDFVATAPAELSIPDFDFSDWLIALKRLNISLNNNGLPHGEEVYRAIEYLEKNCLDLENSSNHSSLF